MASSSLGCEDKEEGCWQGLQRGLTAEADEDGGAD